MFLKVYFTACKRRSLILLTTSNLRLQSSFPLLKFLIKTLIKLFLCNFFSATTRDFVDGVLKVKFIKAEKLFKCLSVDSSKTTLNLLFHNQLTINSCLFPLI